MERKRSENFEVMLRKFFRDVQQSGVLTDIKNRRYHVKRMSRDRLREIAKRKSKRRKIKRGY